MFEFLRNGNKMTMEDVLAIQQEQKKVDKMFESTFDDMVEKGMTLKESAQMSPGYLEGIYAQAYHLYNSGKFADAAEIFRLLILYNSMESKYLMGLAACFHMLKEYVNAIQTYTLCCALDPKNPIPHYHSSDCYIQMKEYLSAMLCLELVIAIAGDRAEYAKMKERAQLSLKSLKEERLANPLEDEPRSTKELKERLKYM